VLTVVTKPLFLFKYTVICNYTPDMVPLEAVTALHHLVAVIW